MTAVLLFTLWLILLIGFLVTSGLLSAIIFVLMIAVAGVSGSLFAEWTRRR